MKRRTNAMQCPECNEGTLRRVVDCVEYMDIVSIVSNTDYVMNSNATVQPIKIGDEGYIGCTACDFMGSPEDVLQLMQPKPEPPPADPRYHSYIVDVLPGKPDIIVTWRLLGMLGTGINTHTDMLGMFADQSLAFAVLYRLTGIKGKPGQSVYTVSLETA